MTGENIPIILEPGPELNGGTSSTVTGGIHEVKEFQNSVEIDELARFAVAEYSKKQNKIVEFDKVVNAKEQVVTGIIYYLTIEVVEDGKKVIYEAKVWVKPWMNFKEVLEFKLVSGSSA
ncbi:cysteine proteinase inhibitor A-like [Macadamia integrifolia]|uniref:cysteine proteinase inhibitor A-like n=1 Tax=Macadamia integrifolia TaxID=60698 RepID=UPI001C4F7A7E|nr:cysteine proteinase inhibitor A-like [Macadamia integrifolia]